MRPPLSPRLTASRKLLSTVAPPALLLLAAFFFPAASASRAQGEEPAPARVTPGSLQAAGPDGKPRGLCPLKHTDVRAEVSGFIARVNVTQEFQNPFPDKIEAVYTFPLPRGAAVDDMTLTVGDRTVRGKVMRREQAQAVYEAARASGQVAGLLDQERPNIFTQSVANISPGESVTVRISYVETLKYEEGTYEFVFPTVVGPRYVPGAPVADRAPQGGGRLPDTDRVPDASRITPHVAAEGTRAGHDISIEVALDAGVPLDGLSSPTHEIESERAGASRARVRLKKLSTIPNKDFILRYDVAGGRVTDAVLTHRGERGGYFALVLQPPERVTAEDLTPKELVFVLDTSGSMSGFPIEKAKEAMRLALDGLNPQDTFNLITFSGETRVLFPEPVPPTPENMARARKFLDSHSGGGGTEMMKAVRAALDPSDSQAHVRVVCFMTDGYVGNDMEIISEIQKHPNARVFSFGVGGSVNRYLLDKMAEQGRGEVEYVGLNDDGSAAARRFYRRVRDPLMTDITVDWNGLPVADVYPSRMPDLFGARPVVIVGRYTGAARGVVRLRGRMAGRVVEREVSVNFPEAEPSGDVLATLWARRRVEDLMDEDLSGAQRGQMREDLREAVTSLGLEHRLMTQFTSFVAVEEVTITDGGAPRRIEVPVELPEGVSRAAVDESSSLLVGGAGRNNRSVLALRSLGGVASTASSVSEVVTVTSSERPMIDTSQPGGTTRIDQSVIDPGSNLKGRGPKVGNARSKKEPAAVVAATPKQPDPEEEEKRRLEEERRQLAARLHPSLFALVERLRKREAPTAEESKLVREGRIELQVFLTEKSPAVLAQLKELGFELIADPRSAKLVIGRLPFEKLQALAELKAVRYVAPQ
jgi:Ca-activated chloride channel homolog